MSAYDFSFRQFQNELRALDGDAPASPETRGQDYAFANATESRVRVPDDKEAFGAVTAVRT